MKINETRTKGLIASYKKDRSMTILRELVQELSPLIYHYPAVVFHCPEDDCSEFYLYLIERLEPFLMKYDPALAGFRTWFFIVLKSQYLNWCRSRSRKASQEVPTFSYEKEERLEDAVFYRAQKEASRQDDPVMETMKEHIEALDRPDYLIVHLLYFHLDGVFLEKLCLFNKKTEEENIEQIKSHLNNKKFRMQARLNERIRNYQHRIHEMAIKGHGLRLEETVRLRKYQQNLDTLKRKRDRNLENLDICSVSSLLGLSVQEIYYRLRKIKQALYTKLKPLVH